jgi:hypothetical protein
MSKRKFSISIFCWFFGLLFCCPSCNKNSNSDSTGVDTVAEEDSMMVMLIDSMAVVPNEEYSWNKEWKFETFICDTAEIDNFSGDTLCHVRFSIDFPVEGPTGGYEELDRLREIISSVMADMTDGVKRASTDGASFTRYNAAASLEYLNEMVSTTLADGVTLEELSEEGGPCSKTFTVEKVYESDEYISLLFKKGRKSPLVKYYTLERGVIYEKGSPHVLDYDWLRSFHDPENKIDFWGRKFRKILVRGLSSYYGEPENISEKELKEKHCLTDISMPQYFPYFTEEGWRFVYQEEELGCAGSGSPSFTIPYEVMDEFISSCAPYSFLIKNKTDFN